MNSRENQNTAGEVDFSFEISKIVVDQFYFLTTHKRIIHLLIVSLIPRLCN